MIPVSSCLWMYTEKMVSSVQNTLLFLSNFVLGNILNICFLHIQKKLCYHVHDLLGPWTLRRISTYICPNNLLKRINKYYFSLFEVSFRTIETDFSAYVQCSSYVTVFAIIPG